MMPNFILLHGSVSPEKIELVVDTISKKCKLIDVVNEAYLFDGDPAIAKEVIKDMIGEFSVSPIRKYEI